MLPSVLKMQILESMNQKFFNQPFEEATFLASKHETSCCESIKMRLYFLAQVISSLIALPMNLLAGLFEAAVNLCTGEDWKGSFSTMGKALRAHGLVAFPASLIGIFAPASATLKCAYKLDKIASC